MFLKELIQYFPEKASPIKSCLVQFQRKFRESGVEISQFWDFVNHDHLCESSNPALKPFDPDSGQVGGKASAPQVLPAEKEINNIFASSSNLNSIQFTLPPPLPIQNGLENGHLLSNKVNKVDKFENLNLSGLPYKGAPAQDQHKNEDPENLQQPAPSAPNPDPLAHQMTQSEQIDHLMTLPDLQQLFDSLKDVIQDDRRFLEFVSYYQSLPSTGYQLKEQVRRLELKCFAKEAELQDRLNNQGFDTSRVEGLAKSPFKADEDVYGEGVSIIKKANGVSYLDPNLSVTQDIEAEGFSDFQEACWILLTTQKPGSVAPDSQLSKDQTKDKDQKASGFQKGNVAQSNNGGPQRAGQEAVEKDTSGSQDTIVASFAGPGGSLGKTNSSRPEGRSTTARAATLERGPGIQNLNQLNQVQIVLPQKRYGHSASIIDNKLFIFGGAYRKGNGASPFHSFYECTLRIDAQRDDLFKWKRIQGEAPRTRDSHSCVSFLDQLLIFGGSCDGECYNDLYKYNITNKIWTKLEPLADLNQAPSPREGHVAVMVGGGDKMLIHGGINDVQNCFDDAYILTGLHKQIDQQQSEVKTNQYGHIINAHELKTRRGQFEVLRWFKCEQEGDVPSARDSHSATLANNQIYLFGGQDTQENLLNDFYKVTLSQGQVLTKHTNEAGEETQYYDRTFKLIWTKIEVRDPQFGQNIPWPIKRSSHSMNLFMNRFLVLIGGETSCDITPCQSPIKQNTDPQSNKDTSVILPPISLISGAPQQALAGTLAIDAIKASAEKLDAEEEKSSSSNRPLNDVWLFDLMLNTWRQVEPVTKVQSSFNNKKLRKSFEPRMAHSASTLGNYIVVFGGYNSQTNQYSPANFSILSLAGCTDYILQKPCTLSMVQTEIIAQRQLLAAQKLKKASKSKKALSKNESKKDAKKEPAGSSNIRIQLDDDDAQQMMENLNNIDAPKHAGGSTQRLGAAHDSKDTKIVIESTPILSKNYAKSLQYKQPAAVNKVGSCHKSNILSSDVNIQVTEQPDPKHRKRGLIRKFKQSRVDFLTVKKLSDQIKRPIQLIADILKGQIGLYERHHQLHERGDSKKQVLNRENFEQLDIWVSLLQLQQSPSKKAQQDINILHFKDSGPGLSHSNLREALTGETPSFCKYSEGLESETVQYFDYFKYAALKLAKHALIITRTVQLNRNSLQLRKDEEKFQEEVHIGMLSGNFIKDSGSTHIVAPIISFKVQTKKDGAVNKDGEFFDLVPLTPLPEKFIGLILEYTGNIFENVEDLKDHIKKDLYGPDRTFQCGTEIYLCGIKQPFHSCEGDIVLIDNIKGAELAAASQDELFQEDIVHSLATQMQYSFIDFPQHVNLSINSKKVLARNPFGDILQFVNQGEDVAIRGESKDFRYWVISEPKLRSLGVQDGLLSKFEGLLIYRGNDFVRAFEECQPSNSQLTNIKTNLRKRRTPYDQTQSILHGIIMVNQEEESASLTFDSQDLSSQTLLDEIMQDVLQNYQVWAAKQSFPNHSDQVPSTTFENQMQSSLDKQENEPPKKIQKTEKPKDPQSAHLNGTSKKQKTLQQHPIPDPQPSHQSKLNTQEKESEKLQPSDSSPESKQGNAVMMPTISQHQFELMTDEQQQEYLAQLQMQQQFHMNHQMMANAQQHELEQQMFLQQQHDLQLQQSYGTEHFENNQFQQQVAVAHHEAFRHQMQQQMMAENMQKEGPPQEGFDHEFEMIESGQNQQQVVPQQFVDQFGNAYGPPQYMQYEGYNGQVPQTMEQQPQSNIKEK